MTEVSPADGRQLYEKATTNVQTKPLYIIAYKHPSIEPTSIQTEDL